MLDLLPFCISQSHYNDPCMTLLLAPNKTISFLDHLYSFPSHKSLRSTSETNEDKDR